MARDEPGQYRKIELVSATITMQYVESDPTLPLMWPHVRRSLRFTNNAHRTGNVRGSPELEPNSEPLIAISNASEANTQR